MKICSYLTYAASAFLLWLICPLWLFLAILLVLLAAIGAFFLWAIYPLIEFCSCLMPDDPKCEQEE
jgi:hypothetical protein